MRRALFLSTHQRFKEQRQNTLILTMPARSRSRSGASQPPGGCWAEGSARGELAGTGSPAGPPREPLRRQGHKHKEKGLYKRQKWI